jgi:hypothetical protein
MIPPNKTELGSPKRKKKGIGPCRQRKRKQENYLFSSLFEEDAPER